MGSLNAADAEVKSVSCPSPGSCVAVGFYTDASHDGAGFLVSQVGGQWQTAMTVPGIDALSGGRGSGVSAVSCSSAGNCVAGGFYSQPASSGSQVFVVTEQGGVWGNARQVPGLKALGKSAALLSLSCPSAGNCGAGGSYTDGSGHRQAFVVSEQSGFWRQAREVPGTRSLNVGGNALVLSV